MPQVWLTADRVRTAGRPRSGQPVNAGALRTAGARPTVGAAVVGGTTARISTATCTDVRPGAAWQVTRQRWGGSLLEEAGLDGTTRLLTVAPHAFEPAGMRVSTREEREGE